MTQERVGSMLRQTSTPPPSPSGLTGGPISPPARWTQRESPVKPANDNVGPTAYTLAL